MARISKAKKMLAVRCEKAWESWYLTALYVRLSHEESEADPTDKIQNQKELLLRYIEGKAEFQLAGIYCDNGFSGRNFERPQWLRLMEDVKAKRVNCIIVKDLSRLGRNYIEAGDYLEKVFPFLGVRFIAVSDGYDSNAAGLKNMEIMLPLKNIINASYAKDLSQKIQSARHIQRIRGEYTGSRIPYGYMRDPHRKGMLIVSEKEAPVVKMIFSWIAEGRSYSATARELNRMRISAPQGKLWSYQTIKVITANEVYVGTLKQGMNCVFGNDLVIRENAHDAIIDRDTFYKVEEQRKRIGFNRADIPAGETWLFQGMLIAANSGKKLYRSPYYKENGAVRVKAYRSPKTYDENGEAYKLVMVREETLLSCMKTVLYTYLDILDGMKDFLRQDTVQAYYREKIRNEDMQIDQIGKQLKRRKELLMDCYTDMVEGVLNLEYYRMYSERYREEIVMLERQVEKRRKDRELLVETVHLKNPYIEHLEQFGKDETITRKLLEQLVSKILVFGSNELEFQFTFADEFSRMQEVITDGGYVC